MLFDETALRALVSEEVRRVLREELGRAGAQHEYLKVGSAAKVVGVSPDTIRGWVDGGQLRRYGLGRLVLVRRDELEALLAAEPGGEDHQIEQAAGAALRRLR